MLTNWPDGEREREDTKFDGNKQWVGFAEVIIGTTTEERAIILTKIYNKPIIMLKSPFTRSFNICNKNTLYKLNK